LTAAEDALLGTERDKIIGRRIGRRHSAVIERRSKLGIPRSGIRAPRANGWQAEDADLLGTAPDAGISLPIGRSAEAVQARWRKLRIPAYRAGRFKLTNRKLKHWLKILAALSRKRFTRMFIQCGD
jgi:hypothetical protein